MDGGGMDEPDREDRPEESDEDWAGDQGSVGDWSLPGWVHRVGWPAWLFVGLALANLVVQYAILKDAAGSSEVDAWSVLERVASALPTLLPVAVLGYARRSRLAPSDPLALGSMAVALSHLLLAAATAIEVFMGGGADVTSRPFEVQLLRIVSVVFAFVGPILLAHAVLRLRRTAVPRWIVAVGVALVVLTMVYLVTVFQPAMSLLVLYSGTDDPLFVDPLRFDLTLAVLRTFTVIGWTYLAWAVIAAATGPGRPRLARRLGFVAVVVQQGLLGLHLAQALFTPTATAETDTTRDTAWVIYLASGKVAVGLAVVASAFLLAAFALGLGRPAADGAASDRGDEAMGLEAVPGPG